jgi:mono/diheme cytochrome c family protein
MSGDEMTLGSATLNDVDIKDMLQYVEPLLPGG